MRIIFGLACLLVAGCAAPKMATNGAVGLVTEGLLPAPAIGDQVGSEALHLVGPFDSLAVEVFGVPELSREVRVDANGRVSLPVVGELDVAGKTPTDIQSTVTSRLRAGYVRNPQVTVNVRETVSRTVTVDGAVTRPGIFPITGQMTMMRAIARAEGTTDKARERHVVIFRTVGGNRMAALYDLEAIRLGMYEDPRVYPNDVVVVGRSRASLLFPQILQAVSLISTPLLLLIR